MTEVIQPTDLKIGIDGVAKPVDHVISEVKTLQLKRDTLIEEISRVDPDNELELDKLQRQLRYTESRIDYYQQPLDIQFPHYPPSPNK
jgi:hypothetical protein